MTLVASMNDKEPSMQVTEKLRADRVAPVISPD
jgi:hypothetical protein